MHTPKTEGIPQQPTIPEAKPPEVKQLAMSFGELATVAAGTWDQDAAIKMDKAEFTRRYVCYRYILREAQAQPYLTGPLPPVDEARELLGSAEAQDQAGVRELFLHPTVGQWVGDTTRRLRHRSEEPGERPLWADLGYAHTLAAVAAHQTGLEATIQVPMYKGQVVLPTLGRATVPYDPSGGEWQTATVRTGNGRLELSTDAGNISLSSELSEDAPGWEAARFLELVASNGMRWKVLVDDLDHFTGLRGPIPPERLTPESFEAWRQVLSAAWEELATHHPLFAQQIAGEFGLRSIVPANPKKRHQTYSVSSGDSPGSAIMSRPQHPVEAAVTIVHEHCGHNVLNMIQYMFPSIQPPPGESNFYVPWRDDPRPGFGVLHGIKAFSVVAEFWRQRLWLDTGPDLEIGQFEFARWRDAVYKVAIALQSHAHLSDLSRYFVNAIRKDLIEPMLNVPVPAEARYRAHLVELDHAFKWRDTHSPISDEALFEAANAWLQGKPMPPKLLEMWRGLAPKPAMGLDVASVLVRMAIESPDVLNQPGMLPPEATPTDVALAATMMRQTGLPPGKWRAIQQAMGHILEAQRRTPHDILSALHARINIVDSKEPSWKELTAWLAKGAVSYLQRQGDELLIPRYRQEEDKELIKEMFNDTIRRNKTGELSAEDAARLLMSLGFLGVGTAVSKRIRTPKVPYTNLPNRVVDPDRIEFGSWRPRVTSHDGRPLAGVRAGRAVLPALWGAVIGDPNERFQRERLGRSLLPGRNYPNGYGGWIYKDSWYGGGYVLTAHVDLAEAVDRWHPEKKIGKIDLFIDDGSFTKNVSYEPGNAASPQSKRAVGSLVVLGRDAQKLLPELSLYGLAA